MLQEILKNKFHDWRVLANTVNFVLIGSTWQGTAALTAALSVLLSLLSFSVSQSSASIAFMS
jgi:hypothetical protein